jgi:hypothetical protein
MRILTALGSAAGLVGAAYGAYAAATWLRYGRPKRASADAADPLLDSFMPDYDVGERHAIAVAAPANVTFVTARELNLYDSRLVRAIFSAREVLMRSQPDATPRPTGLLEQMKAIGWGVLAEVPDREIVMGAVTKPWEPTPTFRSIPADRFAAFAEPDYVKIVWTRAVATDVVARTKFRRYWSLLSPGIILIREATVRALRTAAERNWRIEGDDIVADASAQLTHVTTIDAPPKDVWPWLLQMGCQRAGWYSWDRLDNAGVRSADRIIPELQHLAVGDVIPARPVGTEGFEVRRIIDQRALVLGSLTSQWAGTWAFVLEPIGSDQTRLVTRYRAAYAPSWRMAMMLPAITTVHAFMERKQLRTLKHHAEHMH